jgi:hypothetical protein
MIKYSRKKNRLREVEFEKILEIKEVMKFSWSEVSQLLGFTEDSTQVFNYKKCGKVPADRYYSARDSLLLSLHQEFKEREQQIMQLFS